MSKDKKTKEDKVEKKEQIRKLIFNHTGWCPELSRTYNKGQYICKDEKEYKILKQYAEGE